MSANQKEKKRSDLREALGRVVDERSFVNFLQMLACDWSAASDPSGWENGSIGAFLDAAAGWPEASKKGLRFYDVPSNPWRRGADMLIAGKEYEEGSHYETAVLAATAADAAGSGCDF
ncbi:DUF7660 family protein [Paraburkholderia rhynchosiae]|nr:hypothetical protein [Paraburkholderia rhynchosiae]